MLLVNTILSLAKRHEMSSAHLSSTYFPHDIHTRPITNGILLGGYHSTLSTLAAMLWTGKELSERPLRTVGTVE